jgi:D-serine deaminase-like pyridoxal phosphate-dependent protein
VTIAPLPAVIGQTRTELASPALILDRAALQANIDAMAAWARGKVGIRPHAKIHKSVEIARLQLEAGAIGITVATIWEALAVAAADPPSILIANELIDPGKLALLAQAAHERTHLIAVDSDEGVRALSAAATQAGSTIGALVDIDVGMGRCGVRSVEDALRLAKTVEALPGLELRGVMGYEGHVVTEPDRTLRARKATEAMDALAEYVQALETAGFAIEIVSAGGTNTFDMTGLHPRVTELQAGSYAVMDAWYTTLTPTFRPALTVLARCVSRQGDTAVLDCGTKAITVDYMQPRLPEGCGKIREVHEEHMLLDVTGSDRPRIGEALELTIGYCGGTINLHDLFYVAEDDRVVDLWPIRARGPGRGPA